MVAGQCETVASRVEPLLEDVSLQDDGYTSVHGGSVQGGSAHGGGAFAAGQSGRSQSVGGQRGPRSAFLNPKILNPSSEALMHVSSQPLAASLQFEAI